MQRAPFFSLLFLALLPALAAAQSPRAHVHGEAELDIVADGPALQVRLKAPLESVLGFEHAPRTDRQRDAVRAMAARLRAANNLLVPTPEAQCSLASVRLASTMLPGELLGEDKPSAQAAATASDHGDLEGAFAFRCAAPAKLKGLEARFAQAFPGIHRLRASVVGPRGQKAAVLTKGRTAVAW